MFETDPQSNSKAWHLPRPAAVFAAVAIGLLVVVSGLAQVLFAAPVTPVAVFCVISALSLRGLVTSYPHAVLGACNVITAVRMGLVSLLTGAVMAPADPWVVFALAVIAFASDGLDGWLARRSGLSSAFGARFDMEADALLGAVLGLVLLTAGVVGPAILVLGFSRYVFVVAGWVWPALQGQLPENYRRKTICVIQIAALIALVCPLTPSGIAPWIAGGAAGLLLYSFAVDSYVLMRRGA